MRITNLYKESNSFSRFFDHIEPIQYTLRTWHIRAIGGISFKVSQQWVDMSTYQTTAATTTGYTMSQSVSNNSTVNFKYTENAGDGGMFGFMVRVYNTGLFLHCRFGKNHSFVFPRDL